MATVRLSNTIRYRILSSIREGFNANIQKTMRKIESVDVVQPLIDEVVSSEERHAVDVLGRKWLAPIETAIVSCKTESGASHTWYTKFQPAILPLGFQQGRPPNVLKPEMVGYNEVAPLIDHLAWLRTEHNKVEQSVNALLKDATTVNAVQKVWPSVIEHLDQNTLTELRRPAEKQVRKKPPPLVVDEATAASLITLNLTKNSK